MFDFLLLFLTFLFTLFDLRLTLFAANLFIIAFNRLPLVISNVIICCMCRGRSHIFLFFFSPLCFESKIVYFIKFTLKAYYIASILENVLLFLGRKLIFFSCVPFLCSLTKHRCTIICLFCL